MAVLKADIPHAAAGKDLGSEQTVSSSDSEVLPALPPPPDLRSAADCRAYIGSLPGGFACLERADQLSHYIEASHPVDQDFYHWAADGLGAARDQLEESLIASCCQGHLVTNWEGHSSSIPTALESVLVAGIHSSAMESIEMVCGPEDAALHEIAVSKAQGADADISHKGWRRKDLAAFCSVPEHFLGLDLGPGAAALQHMEQASCCPLEVAEGIEDSIHLLVEAASASSDGEGSGPGHDITADDVLGLMIATVILAQPRRLMSMLEYVKAFYSSGDWAGQTGFQIATLEAATAFLLQQAPIQDISVTAGAVMDRDSSMSLVWALLDSDEPLTFVQNAAPLQTAVQKASQSDSDAQSARQLKHLLSRSSFKYGNTPALRSMLSEELTERAASLHRAPSLQRVASSQMAASLQGSHSRGSITSSVAPGSPLLPGTPGPYSFASSMLLRQDSRSSSYVSLPAGLPDLPAPGSHSGASADRPSTAQLTSLPSSPGRRASSSDSCQLAANRTASSSIEHSGRSSAAENWGTSSSNGHRANAPALASLGNAPGDSRGQSSHARSMQPMPSPFKNAAVKGDPVPQRSRRSDGDQLAKRTAPGKHEGANGSEGDSGDPCTLRNELAGSGGLGRSVGSDRGQLRPEKSDKLATALLRMSLRADEQLREQARLVLQSSTQNRI